MDSTTTLLLTAYLTGYACDYTLNMRNAFEDHVIPDRANRRYRLTLVRAICFAAFMYALTAFLWPCGVKKHFTEIPRKELKRRRIPVCCFDWRQEFAFLKWWVELDVSHIRPIITQWSQENPSEFERVEKDDRVTI